MSEVPLYHIVLAQCVFLLSDYKGTSPTRKRSPLGPYRSHMPRVLGGFNGGWVFSHERGTLVAPKVPKAPTAVVIPAIRAIGAGIRASGSFGTTGVPRS